MLAPISLLSRVSMKRTIRFTSWSLVVMGGVAALAARSASVQMPTLEQRKQMYYRYLKIPDRIQGLDLVRPHWMADGNSFWYAEDTPANTVIYKVNPVANTKTELFDREHLRAVLSRYWARRRLARACRSIAS
jgi:hypothetical protein